MSRRTRHGCSCRRRGAHSTRYAAPLPCTWTARALGHIPCTASAPSAFTALRLALPTASAPPPSHSLCGVQCGPVPIGSEHRRGRPAGGRLCTKQARPPTTKAEAQCVTAASRRRQTRPLGGAPPGRMWMAGCGCAPRRSRPRATWFVGRGAGAQAGAARQPAAAAASTRPCNSAAFQSLAAHWPRRRAHGHSLLPTTIQAHPHGRTYRRRGAWHARQHPTPLRAWTASALGYNPPVANACRMYSPLRGPQGPHVSPTDGGSGVPLAHASLWQRLHATPHKQGTSSALTVLSRMRS